MEFYIDGTCITLRLERVSAVFWTACKWPPLGAAAFGCYPFTTNNMYGGTIFQRASGRPVVHPWTLAFCWYVVDDSHSVWCLTIETSPVVSWVCPEIAGSRIPRLFSFLHTHSRKNTCKTCTQSMKHKQAPRIPNNNNNSAICNAISKPWH